MPRILTIACVMLPCIRVKGAGERATTGVPAALMNAARDALSSAGVPHFDMPVTPERVWQALQAARAGNRLMA